MGSDEEEIEERPWRQLLRHTGNDENGPPQITVRAVLAGLLIGSLLCVTRGGHARPQTRLDHFFCGRFHSPLSPPGTMTLRPPDSSFVLSRASPCVRLPLVALSCFTNMYFGLQTGWVTMGSIQSALIGYGLFQLPWRRCAGRGRGYRPFGPLENVVVQTVSVATATLPLAGGFIGIIPALGMLDPPVVLTTSQLL